MSTRSEKEKVVRCAEVCGIVLLFAAMIQGIITLLTPVSASADAFKVYARNILSIAGFALIAIFLIRWCAFVYGEIKAKKSKCVFRLIIVLGAIVCSLKGLHSVYVTVTESHRGLFVIGYYTCDLVAWLALAAFLITYRIFKLTKKQEGVSLTIYRLGMIVLSVVCGIKATSGGIYALMNYINANSWVYYLGDAVGWAMMSVFLAMYAKSYLVRLVMSKK